MKKLVKTLVLAAMAMFAMTSCEDVPEPYIIPGSSNEPAEEIEAAGTGTATDPFNVKGVQAFIEEGEYGGKEIYFKGIITSFKEAPGNTYGNATFYIADVAGGSNTFYVYRCYGLNGNKFTDASNMVVGDTVVVKSTVTNYNGTYETEQNKGQIVTINGKAAYHDSNETPDTPSEAKGTGTQADPFNVAAAVAYCQSLGADVNSDKEVYIKGKVSSNTTTDATISSYGNMTFTMIDEGNTSVTFTAFQVYGLGNKKFTSASQIKEGDEVVVYGKVVNYKGNTPETVGKGSAYVYSINGKTEEGGNDDQPSTGEAKGTGSLSDPYNVAAVVAYCNSLGADVNSENEVYVKGKVSANNTSESTISSYGNMTFTIIDEGNTSTTFTAFQVYGPNKEKFTSPSQIKVGDEVIVCGKVVNYKGNTPETVGKGASYVYSINGKTEMPTGGDNGGDNGGGSADTGDVDLVIAASDLGLANGAAFESVTVNGITITVDGGGNTNSPKYYTNGGNLRMYPKNTLKITAGKKIATVVLTCTSGSVASGDVSATPGSVKVDDPTITISSINSESTTISNNNGSTGSASQIRIEKIAITYAK